MKVRSRLSMHLFRGSSAALAFVDANGARTQAAVAAIESLPARHAGTPWVLGTLGTCHSELGEYMQVRAIHYREETRRFARIDSNGTSDSDVVRFGRVGEKSL